MFKWLFKKKGCAKHMNNKLEVIGIDHGWSMMKTMDSGYHLRMQSQDILQVCYFWKQIRYSTSVMMEFTRQAVQTITSFDVTDK